MALEMLKILLSGSWTLLDPFVEFIQVCTKYYESLVENQTVLNNIMRSFIY